MCETYSRNSYLGASLRVARRAQSGERIARSGMATTPGTMQRHRRFEFLRSACRKNRRSHVRHSLRKLPGPRGKCRRASVRDLQTAVRTRARLLGERFFSLNCRYWPRFRVRRSDIIRCRCPIEGAGGISIIPCAGRRLRITNNVAEPISSCRYTGWLLVRLILRPGRSKVGQRTEVWVSRFSATGRYRSCGLLAECH